MNAGTKASIQARRMAFFGCALRTITPATLIGMVAVACLFIGVVEQVQILERARAINQQRNDLRAHLVAETALVHDAAALSRSWRSEPLHLSTVTASIAWHGDMAEVKVSAPDCAAVLVSQRLAGGAPTALTAARAAMDRDVLEQIGGGLRLSPRQWPKLDRAALAVAETATATHGFRRDSEIALRHLPSGTDRPDFVWSANGRRARHPADGLLIVPGNLWLDGAARLCLDLDHDLTVKVTGNIYVLRSLHVCGRGRLLLVTDASEQAVVFADVDGSGGWSAGDPLHRGATFGGPIEGAGSVYLGLPGGCSALECDAGILVGGELHVAARAHVRGPLLLRFGCTQLGDEAQLAPPQAQFASTPQAAAKRRGQWVFAAGRDAVPGFEVTGRPRPGRVEFRSR